MKFKHIFLGGTFDGLHKGHETVLRRALQEGEKVTIGLTSDEYVRNFKLQNSKLKIENTFQISNYTFQIRNYIERKRALTMWLNEHGTGKSWDIISINDPYEPAASGGFDALVVTKDNIHTGIEINRRRRERRLAELSLIEVPVVPAQDKRPISSSRVRNGEIDGHGNLIMPQSLIPMLRSPLGRIIQEKDIQDPKGKIIITVGDRTSKTFIDWGIMPDLAIVDGMVARKPFHGVLDLLQPEKASPFQAKSVKSGPGFISKKAMQVIQEMLTKLEKQGRYNDRGPLKVRPCKVSIVIIVDGEEDLLALPAIINAPVGSFVYYGQPGKGIVEVVVTRDIQCRTSALLQKFSGYAGYS